MVGTFGLRFSKPWKTEPFFSRYWKNAPLTSETDALWFLYEHNYTKERSKGSAYGVEISGKNARAEFE